MSKAPDPRTHATTPPPLVAAGRLLVRDVMTPRVRTIGRRDGARAAAVSMRTRRIQHLVVVDAAGRVCGVLSDRDIRTASRSSAEQSEGGTDPLTRLRVEDLMAPNPVTVRPTDSVGSALSAMRTKKIGCLAVVDELGCPVGIVTGYDVVTLALQLLSLVDARVAAE